MVGGAHEAYNTVPQGLLHLWMFSSECHATFKDVLHTNICHDAWSGNWGRFMVNMNILFDNMKFLFNIMKFPLAHFFTNDVLEQDHMPWHNKELYSPE